MSDKGYTDDEVAEAIKWTVCEVSGDEVLKWAASEYLKAKPVIEWYGLEHKYETHRLCNERLCSDLSCDKKQCKLSEMFIDKGAKAREYLEKLNQNKGE